MDLGQQEFNGNGISPVLPDGFKNYLIDNDQEKIKHRSI
jgi:hypothetical protein